ncbi:MAG TPA: branched-chain amino acid aminotransferase, partial [Beutenbergiaceae bacterium]|nr:branched-chain amino acid aminotransferase [Beutenbergiaceae bacterium]
MTTFKVKPSPHPHTLHEREAALADLRFGHAFTDHMARARWQAGTGWHDFRVEAYAPLMLDPATAVLHYAQEVFEGLKAYRHADGSVWTFRPWDNAARLASSAQRLALPEVSEEMFLSSIETLVRTDVEWVPSIPGSSLYLRPFMFASEKFIGVRPSQEVEYLVIASPVGPYFASGFTPVSIWVEREFSRAGPGGTGAAKFGGNYAASLLPQKLAAQKGCDQVCFLDAATGTKIEELGGMNTFFVTADGALHTPELSGSILQGITRSSIIEFATAQGRKVVERPITLQEVRRGVEEGD